MSGSGPGRREVAYRLFAAEFDDAELSYSESDEERAPNYVVTPTGARVNRLFAVGVLTEVEDVNPEMVRGRVVGPTGAFVTYAGQYQPEALAFLERTEPPAFLALSGKARTYEPEDGDRIYTSVRPETVSEVDSGTRNRWVVTAAERTVERIGIAASAVESGLSGDRLRAALSEAGVDDRLAEGVALALEHYGTTPAYLEALRGLAIEAVRVVAGERDEVGRLEVAPDGGAGDASPLATLDLEGTAPSPRGRSEETAATGDNGPEPAAETTESATEGEELAAEPDPARSGSGSKPAEGRDTDDEATPGEGSGAAADIGETPEPTDEPSSTETETAEMASEPTEDGEGAMAGADDGESETQSPASEADAEAVEEELDDFDPGEFELDEEERREVQEEFGTEFSTAGEVEPSESGSDEDGKVDRSESVDAEDDELTAVDTEPAGADAEPATEPEATETEPSAGAADGDVDLTDAVMDAMDRLDDGEGADRDAIVSTVADEHGAEPDDVEAAIQDALMGGRCYEPTDGTLKSI
jgi:RPA family protein